MRIPDPYFENVLEYGDFHMEQIIVEYDYPLLSVLIDDQNNRYVSICYSVMEAQRWIIAPISTSELIDLLTNKITLNAPYKTSDITVILAVRDYKTKRETFNAIRSSDIPEECLPGEGEYLDAEKDEWASYIGQLQQEMSEWVSAFHLNPIITNNVLGEYTLHLNSIQRRNKWSDLETNNTSQCELKKMLFVCAAVISAV